MNTLDRVPPQSSSKCSNHRCANLRMSGMGASLPRGIICLANCAMPRSSVMSKHIQSSRMSIMVMHANGIRKFDARSNRLCRCHHGPTAARDRAAGRRTCHSRWEVELSGPRELQAVTVAHLRRGRQHGTSQLGRPDQAINQARAERAMRARASTPPTMGPASSRRILRGKQGKSCRHDARA
eukprot:SAG31_NODE_1096_length_9920_cov_14.794216_7_plen_182_part_00